jgi:hypothetical protein
MSAGEKISIPLSSKLNTSEIPRYFSIAWKKFSNEKSNQRRVDRRCVNDSTKNFRIALKTIFESLNLESRAL